MKVMTVVGTRPEIIRLAPTLKKLDQFTDHVLVHTGQNYDYELNEVFFEDLNLRRPDYFLEADVSSLGATLGSIITRTEEIIRKEQPDAFLVLGDTNSAISAVIAKRMKVPVYHMEAGNRAFDQNVPEETNRRMIDHIADYNMVYTEHARRNLLAEGLHPSRIMLTGSPMKEVLDGNREQIEAANVEWDDYFLVSLHREENVDNPERLQSALAALSALHDKYGIPVLVSTHPRTRKRLQGIDLPEGIVFHPPFGFNEYVKLQQNARAVLSDSGTISEESSLLDFPAVTLRDAIERPESIDTGAIITAGVTPEGVLQAVEFALAQKRPIEVPRDYQIDNTSDRAVAFILSTAPTHHERSGIRQPPVTANPDAPHD